jgi:ABC-type nitrate/sulfonate/bicarbonate transport system substrate-binding protein
MDTVPPILKHRNAIGIADGTGLLRSHAKGAPIRAFATMFQASPLGIAVLDSSPVHRLAQLKGKRIGLHAYDRPQLGTMLASAGVKLEEVTVVEIGDDIDSLLSGKIDAQMCYLVDETVALEQRGAKVRTFPGYEHGYLAYSQVYFCSEKTLKAQPDLLRRFVQATNEGWELALVDVDAMAALIVKKYLPGGSIAAQRRSLELIRTYLTVESGPGTMGWMKRSTWKKSAQGAGMPLDDFVDYSILTALNPKFRP